MVNRLMTEDQVKEYLGIPDFRHASKDVLVKFVSAIPYINKDVAVKIIEQFPEFSMCAQSLVSHYSTVCEAMLQDNGRSEEAAMQGYQTTLDALKELATMQDISIEDRHRFAETMVFVADRMAALDAENKRYHAEMARGLSLVIGIFFLLGSAILGVNMQSTRIPRI